MRTRFFLSLLLLSGLGACTKFPTPDAAPSQAAQLAPYPTLLPFGPLTAATAVSPPIVDPAVELEARAAALRRRAAWLDAQPSG